MASVVRVVRLGHAALRATNARIPDLGAKSVVTARANLHLALEQFRAARGFGRAISAPQARRLMM